ncbi:MAG: hypothetical protein IKJ93_03370 [Clostridia bacterium]|nr:hypothetical protein [Clostridia bacterium]
MKVAKRLESIETHIEMLTKYAPIIVAIDKHIHYDELPKDEYKTLYCEYIGIDRETFEKVAVMVLGDLHIILRKIEPPTDKELQAIIAEVEEKVLN